MSKLSRKYGQNHLAREWPYFSFFIGLDSSVLLMRKRKRNSYKNVPSPVNDTIVMQETVISS